MATFRVLQLTDLHVFNDRETRLKGIPTLELLEDVVQHILATGESFDHVVVTGDHTHDELPESYQAVRRILTPWLDRLWQVPGNHDDRSVMRSIFGDRIHGVGQDLITFSFTAGRWRCLGVVTQVPGAVPGRILAEQVEWIRRQIVESDADRVGLFMHHPPVDVGSLWMDPIGLAGKELLHELVAAEKRIQLVCCGHVHHEFAAEIGNAKIFTTPSTAIQFHPAGSQLTLVADPPGYRIIELTDDGFSTTVCRLSETRYP
ncbi:MAG: metallophosphoesterase, partial [Planctomycetota bacterium]|nr:metallophosphoesterase [Planctomycetota bacterium]